MSTGKVIGLINALAGDGGSGGGSSGGVLVVHETENEPFTLEKTWKEIHDVYEAGTVVMLYPSSEPGGIYYLTSVSQDPLSGKYGVNFQAGELSYYYVADTPSDYPVPSN